MPEIVMKDGDHDEAGTFEAEEYRQSVLFKSKRDIPVIRHTGICHNPACECQVEAPKLFCDNVCADEYEKYRVKH